VVLGVVVNRLNVSVIAFNWNVTPRYVPSVMEILTTITLVTMGVTVFRWVVNRMPCWQSCRSTARRGETREDAHDFRTTS